MTDRTRERRDAQSLGGQLGIDRAVPDASAARASIVNVERLIQAVLRSEVTRFRTDTELLRMYFSHVFDPMLSATEREEFVANFQRVNPEVVLGYPRTSTQFPCVAIILLSEQEETDVLGDFGGHTTEDEYGLHGTAGAYLDYEAVLMRAQYGIQVLAQHPDQCLYLYHWVKTVLFGAKQVFLANGVLEIGLSGAELMPDERFLPETIFARMLTATVLAPFTVPVFAAADVRRMRVTGMFREDVVVDGMPGGMYTPEGYDG